MSRKLLFVVIIGLMTTFGYSQSIKILQFTETTFDFGTFKEETGPVDHEFQFVNVSDRPIQIQHVKASCGCTTPGWSRDTIPPGGSGYVMARYDPTGRPGAFNKNLTVTSVPIGPPVKLFIRGVVSPKPITVEDELPVVMGDLRVKYRILNMGKVKLTKEPVTREFEVYNGGDTIVVFKDMVEKPAHVDVSFSASSLEPKERGLIRVTYHPMELNDLGFQNENVTIYTNEPEENSRKSFTLYANIEDKFPPMTREELANAPLISYEKTEHDFGRVKQNSKLTTTFSIKNDGKNDLIIRKVQSNCSCVIAKIESLLIAPGESTILNVEFNTRSRRSSNQKAITIYTNSPKKPISRVIVKAYVETN